MVQYQVAVWFTNSLAGALFVNLQDQWGWGSLNLMKVPY